MSKTMRACLFVTLVAVIAAGALTLVSTPTEARQGWTKCPDRQCTLPCTQDPIPTLECKSGGSVILTDFANCCCCGLGDKWRPL